MKKLKSILLIAVIFLLLCSVAVLFGCRTEGETHYNVTYTASEGGYIDGETEQEIKSGENAEPVTAVPYEGYEFVKWSDGSTAPERQDNNVYSDMHFEAEFKAVDPVIPVPKEYSVIYNSGAGGYIEGKTHQIVKENEDAEKVTAIPEEGYEFKKWLDGIETAERHDRNITADKTYTAIFERIKLKVTYKAGAGGTIDGTAEQEIAYGNDAEFVVAVPDEGYRFVKWSDGNGSTIRKETNVTTDICVTAEFEFLYEGGEGTQLNPFTIANYTQLNDMWYYPESNYKLLNDLDLSGISHEPIFDKINFFKGNFDGNGHTVKNLTVETESNCPSLFGVTGGSISNLNIIDANIKTTNYDTLNRNDNYYVGVLAGMVKGYVHGVNVKGKIVANGFSYAGIAIGGLVGYANGTVANCSCNVQMDIKNIYSESLNLPFVFGGMIGVCDSAFVRDCQAEGQINITECYWTESGDTGDLNKSAEIVVGGLIGYYFTDIQVNAYIKNSITHVNILGDNHYNAGGFVGYFDVGQDTTLQITECSVYGDITCGRVGGFVYRAYNSRNSILLFEKCIIENNITAFSYGAGFVYFCGGSSNGTLQIKNCSTKGNIRTCNVFNPERVVGYAAGFGWQMSYVSIMNSFVKRNMISNDGRGFSFSISNSEVSSCFYEGAIDISNGAGLLRGVGMFDIFSSSTLDNCYVNVNFVTGDKDTSNLYALIRQGGGKISNFYCYGNYCKIFERYNMQNVVNGHVFKGSIEEINFPQEGDESDIAIYESAEDMHYLAGKLNKGLDEAIWINVENGLPELNIHKN